MKSIGWDTSFHLNGKFPLLDNSIFPSLNAAKLFVSDSTSSAIAGTIIGVDNPSNSNETGLYEIFNDSGELALRKLVSEGTLAGYKNKIDSLITDLSGNYSSELAELAAQQAKQLETLRDEMFSPDNDTTPITRTMMLQVGADSTNYRFSTNEIGSKDTDGVVFNSSDKSLTFLSGTLYHFSITDDSGKPRTWSISDSSYIELEGTETPLGKYIHLQDYVNKGESLWVYLKVPKTEKQGKWFLSPTKYGCILDDTQLPGEGISVGNTAYYYLLYGYCGVTSSEIPFFEPVYGNTWIKGSTIYTGKVQTMDGYSALDLDNNTLKLGNDFYYADGQVVVGNPDTGAFVFHKHGDNTALHVGTMTKDSDGTESWNGMTFANGELTIGKYEEKLQEMQTQLDKEVSTWYGYGIPLPYKETEEGNIIDSVNSDLAASYNNNTLITENGIKKFNLSPSPELLSYHINDIYINTITGTGYRLVVTNYGIETQSVYWLQLSQGDLQNILNQINSVNSEVNNIKTALDITEDGQTTIGDKFIETMMLRIGADSTNYTLSETSTSGNRMQNLQWSIEDQNVKLNVSEGENLHHSVYYWTDPTNNSTKTYDWNITKPTNSIINVSKTSTTPYYLYIKCSKISNTAEWLATNTARSLQDSLYYYFPFGTVVDPSTRALVEVRGNTKIIGDRIITGKLESNTGNSFFDLDNGQFALGVDQNNPADLDKAAFSFDGNKVHIGGNLGLKYVNVTVNYIDNFNMSVGGQGKQFTEKVNVPIGTVENLRSILFENVPSGNYTLKFINPTSKFTTNNDDYKLTESQFRNGSYMVAIGDYSVDINSEDKGIIIDNKKIQNTLIDVTISRGIGQCSVTLSKPSNIYLILGSSSKNGSDYNFQFEKVTSSTGIPIAPFGQAQYLIQRIELIELQPESLGSLQKELGFLGSTDISGGLVLTNCLGVRNSNGDVTAGLCGINDDSNKTAFWAGSTIDTKESAPVKLTFNGVNSQIGPLKVASNSQIEVIGASNTSKKCLIDNSDSACIKVQNGRDVLKLEASDISSVTSAVYNTSDSWESPIISSGFKKQEGTDGTTSIELVHGTIDISKTENTENGTYTHTVTSYNTYPVPTTLKFIGNQTNQGNSFGLKAKINLWIKRNNDWVKIKSLASIDKPITSWKDKDNGLPRLDSQYKSFLATFDATSHRDLITLDDFGKEFKITLDIEHLSRWWLKNSSSKTIIIDNSNILEKDVLKEWAIFLTEDSGLKVKCNYSAKFTKNEGTSSGCGSVGIKYAQGLIAPEGLQFIKDLNMFSVKVGSNSLIIALGGLPHKTSGTYLGIDSNGHLCTLPDPKPSSSSTS